MKTILVDAVHCLLIKGRGINKELFELLEEWPNRKLLLTNATEDKMKALGFEEVSYEVFTLNREPPKTNPEYFRRMLKHYGFKPGEVLYIEHNEEVVNTASSLGIQTHLYNGDLKEVKVFLDANL